MKAAVVCELGKTPEYGDFEEPVAFEGEVCVTVIASALTNFTKVRAAGKHFSFNAKPPFIVGIDGVGRLDDGRRVYFLFPRPPHGGMAERTVVSRSQYVEVPDVVDDITLAAIADPGMSAWVALEARAKLVHGETVLVNGATGSAGSMAVQIAKFLGAKKVIATGRNQKDLEGVLSIGADEVILLADDGSSSPAVFKKHFEQGVDIVLDHLWGSSAESLIAAASAQKSRNPTRFVQIGTASSPDIRLAGMSLRSSNIQLMGSGIGSVAPEQILEILARLFQAAAVVGFKIATEALPLSHFGDVWSTGKNTPRIVFTMNV
jgi:NADPH:quinone reductase-like Zn-dependent oxidoreductase